MSRREDIDNAIWSDPAFAELTPHAKLIYLWSWTNQRCGMAGRYKVSRGAIVFECTVTEEQVSAALAELEETRFLFYDGEWLWARTRIKHLRSKGPNIGKAVGTDVRKAPADHEYRIALLETYGGEEWLSGYLPLLPAVRPLGDPSPTLPKGSPDGSQTPTEPLAEVPISVSVSVSGQVVQQPQQQEDDARARKSRSVDPDEPAARLPDPPSPRRQGRSRQVAGDPSRARWRCADVARRRARDQVVA